MIGSGLGIPAVATKTEQEREISMKYIDGLKEGMRVRRYTCVRVSRLHSQKQGRNTGA